jgi:hypothetical protein
MDLVGRPGLAKTLPKSLHPSAAQALLDANLGKHESREAGTRSLYSSMPMPQGCEFDEQCYWHRFRGRAFDQWFRRCRVSAG